MNLLIVCGGTAGHINPALAIAEEMQKRIPESNILFIGADKPLEKRLIPAAGFHLENIKMSGLSRSLSPRGIIRNIKAVRSLLKANKKSSKVIKEFSPDAVIGTGGYICYPVLKKAAKLKIPTFILEPNAYPGLTVRMLSQIVDKIFVAFNGMEDLFTSAKDSVVFTGTPLRKDFIKQMSSDADSNLTDSVGNTKPLVVSYWGSLGASEMNQMMVKFIERNIAENKFNHIHATGISSNANPLNSIKDTSREDINEPMVDIREYIDDMPSVMKAATIVLSRAGASTIAELTALGKPAILVPSPNVTDNHQEKNAEQLNAVGGALMIRESECTGDTLFDIVSSTVYDKTRLEKMSTAQKTLSVEDASERIINIILDSTEKSA